MAVAAPLDPEASAQGAWDDALLAAACIVVDPAGLGGVRVRAGAGPVRDAWNRSWRALVPAAAPVRGVPLAADDGRLFGGLDLPASLRAGRPVVSPGLLAEVGGGFAVLSMAERIASSTAARIAAALDAEAGATSRFAAIAFDEGDDDQDGFDATLAERLALSIDLRRCALRTIALAVPAIDCTPESVARARARLPQVAIANETIEALCAAAVALGIDSLRVPLFAVRAARAIAALDGRDAVVTDDAATAARLVYAPRATRLAALEPESPAPATPPERGDGEDDAPSPPEDVSTELEESTPAPREALDEVVLEAALAAMPAGLLERLARGAGPQRSGASNASGAGASGRIGQRGAPAGIRRGRPRPPERLSLVDTLRAAAPWQRIRRAEALAAGRPATRVQVRADDLHVVRFSQRHPTTTVFVVDASGSAALHRLAEAKGAVELLLADCYVRRDSVAVLAFRGTGTQLLLPPTRSLVRARRSLAGLPGGGGTPLASALDATRELVVALRRRGDTALVVLLTDGRANVARDGSGGRPRAEADALLSARLLCALRVDALLVDTSPQPHPQAARVAAAMGATYRPLPHAGATEMSAVVNRAARGRPSVRS